MEIISNEALRTYDRYGKVTIIVEEAAFSDQLAMLNVLITDIFALAPTRAYQALQLPLGSSLVLHVKY